MRGRNPNVWRKDAKGNVIYKAAYGTTGQYGWLVVRDKVVSRAAEKKARRKKAAPRRRTAARKRAK